MSKTIMQKITPDLWFDNNAEEAANFTPRFSKTQKSYTFPAMEKQRQKSLEDQRGR
jgi:predicted 3-demethylubiquinone-9 3-methyltransferase (glyoxalase superfamily)